MISILSHGVATLRTCDNNDPYKEGSNRCGIDKEIQLQKKLEKETISRRIDEPVA
jgi:hypothetical protein